jgi:hypothetical protein
MSASPQPPPTGTFLITQPFVANHSSACSLPPPQRSVIADYPYPNTFKRTLVLQAALQISPNPVILLPGSLIRATSVLAAGSVVPSGSVSPAGVPIAAPGVLTTAVTLAADAGFPAGTVFAAGLTYAGVAGPSLTLQSAVVSTQAVILPAGSYNNLTFLGPATLDGAISLPFDDPLTTTVQMPAGTTQAFDVVLPDGSIIAAGTPINQALPPGTTTTTGGSLVLPIGTIVSGPLLIEDTVGGASLFLDPVTVPVGSTFGVGATIGVVGTPVVIPGPYTLIATLALDAPITVPAGSTFPVGSVLPFAVQSTESTIITATQIVLNDIYVTQPAIVAAGSILTIFSIIASGTVLPYGNYRPVILFDCNEQGRRSRGKTYKKKFFDSHDSQYLEPNPCDLDPHFNFAHIPKSKRCPAPLPPASVPIYQQGISAQNSYANTVAASIAYGPVPFLQPVASLVYPPGPPPLSFLPVYNRGYGYAYGYGYSPCQNDYSSCQNNYSAYQRQDGKCPLVEPHSRTSSYSSSS